MASLAVNTTAQAEANAAQRTPAQRAAQAAADLATHASNELSAQVQMAALFAVELGMPIPADLPQHGVKADLWRACVGSSVGCLTVLFFGFVLNWLSVSKSWFASFFKPLITPDCVRDLLRINTLLTIGVVLFRTFLYHYQFLTYKWCFGPMLAVVVLAVTILLWRRWCQRCTPATVSGPVHSAGGNGGTNINSADGSVDSAGGNGADGAVHSAGGNGADGAVHSAGGNGGTNINSADGSSSDGPDTSNDSSDGEQDDTAALANSITSPLTLANSIASSLNLPNQASFNAMRSLIYSYLSHPAAPPRSIRSFVTHPFLCHFFNLTPPSPLIPIHVASTSSGAPPAVRQMLPLPPPPGKEHET